MKSLSAWNMLALALCSVASPLANSYPQHDFGPVDLGYAVHIPTSISTTSVSNLTYATYANIRFAQPPTGDRRFRAPVTPPPKAHGIQDGKYPLNFTDCMMTAPPYYPFAFAGTSWGHEDCLFLDVKVPAGVKKGDKVPVLHWLYGAGYSLGSKNWSGDPAALFQVLDSPDQKFITVSSNYRLGSPGWVSGPGLDMVPNAGLWDGIASVEWTKKYISNFGGDPDQITVMGESSGGGIINHMITAWDGEGRTPFHQAVLTSTGYIPHIDSGSRMTSLFESLIGYTNCTTVSCLRSLPEADLAAANAQLINKAPPGFSLGPGIGFGPVIDGELVTGIPDIMISEGKYRQGIKNILTSNMLDDGNFGGTDNETWPDFLLKFMQTPTNKTLSEVAARYPPNPQHPGAPFNDFATDAGFACHSQPIANAWGENAYRYFMSTPPATHAVDQGYYFYVDEIQTPGQININIHLARQFQRYLKNFILYGTPNGNGKRGYNQTPPWPNYNDSQVVNITSDTFVPTVDPWSLDNRCQFIRDLLQDPANGV